MQLVGDIDLELRREVSGNVYLLWNVVETMVIFIIHWWLYHSFGKFRGFPVQGRQCTRCWGFDGEQERHGFGIRGADVLAGETGTKHTTILLQLSVGRGTGSQNPCDGAGEWCQMLK